MNIFSSSTYSTAKAFINITLHCVIDIETQSFFTKCYYNLMYVLSDKVLKSITRNIHLHFNLQKGSANTADTHTNNVSQFTRS